MSASYYFKQSFMFCFSLVHFNHYCVFSHLLLSEEVKNGAFLKASFYTNPQDPAVCLCNRKLPWLSLVSEVHNFLKPKEYQINLCTFGFVRAVCCEDGHFYVSRWL